MFILVNHCQDTGLMELGRYATREEAAKDIAKDIANDYQIDVDMDKFITPYKDIHGAGAAFKYDDSKTYIWFDGYDCCCYNWNIEDDWVIIEV